MTTQLSPASHNLPEPKVKTWMQRPVLFILFLVFGIAIVFFGSNFFDLFPTNFNLTYNLVVASIFLAAAVWLKVTKRWSQYWLVPFAYFIASAPYIITNIFNGSQEVLSWFKTSIETSKGIAIDKVYSVVMMVVPMLLLTWLSREKLSSIFIKRGNWKLGLSIGFLVWLNLAASAFLFFPQRFTSMNALVAAVVWGLVFSFANGFFEELWLRGIFLKRFQPLLGVHGSVWATAIVFAMMHAGAVYLIPFALPFMVANTLTLGLACGYLMMKSDSIWGAVLIHAGADFFLFIALLASA
jgi:membrane protease YdiL (CAAX protease family)